MNTRPTDHFNYLFMKTLTRSAFLIATLLLLLSAPVTAQAPVNDECATAIHIDHPENYCSEDNELSNYNYTPSTVLWPSCFQFGIDEWFTFEAPSAQMQIDVFAPEFFGFGPCNVALYSGDCNNLVEVACAANSFSPISFTELNATGLTPGQTYYIRIASQTQGEYQLCIKSFLEADLSGDCPTATLICDKTTTAVGFVAGPGNDPNEWDDADCLIGFPGEFNSTWFVFTAATDGTLEFTITPNIISDDLDFLVYRLPNGPGDCTGKILERCEVAGDYGPGPCYGATGLNATSTDISEPPGCLQGQDNFLRYMDIMAGETYALAVNNFTSTGNGFTIDWGGTVEFQGPALTLATDKPGLKVCRGETIQVRDSIYYPNGTIEKWLWDYGASSQPAADTTAGPHTIQYLDPGLKQIDLSIKADLGCVVKRSLQIQVDSCCAMMAAVNLVPNCLPDTSCFDAVATVENGIQPYGYEWSNAQTDSIATMLHDGGYSLILQDAVGCRDTVNFTVQTNGDVNFPNAFTPNNDGNNDVFGPVGKNIQIVELKIWNRWGQLVYNNNSGGWDGKVDGQAAPSDVYVYHMRVRKLSGQEIVMTGQVNLLR